MNHATNATEAIARAFLVLSCESTPAEIAPHLTREDCGILRDLATWAQDTLAARPPIKPATDWRTPTEHVKALAARIGEGRAVVGRKPASFFPKRRRSR